MPGYVGNVENFVIFGNALGQKRFVANKAITPHVSILGLMFLHNTYINVATANIFQCPKSLYDLLKLKFKNGGLTRSVKKGCGQKHLFTIKCNIGVQSKYLRNDLNERYLLRKCC